VKNSLLIALCFLLGVAAGYLLLESESELLSRGVTYVLFLLIFFVGVGVGANVQVWQVLKRMHFRIFFVPFAVVFGTLMGVGAASFFLRDIGFFQALAVGSGFGYYSLSSVIIAREAGGVLGMTALVSNLLRELATLLLAPLLVHLFGDLAPVACGGATAMDTTLPVIAKVSGEEYAVIGIFSGVVLTVLVPVLVPLFLKLGFAVMGGLQ